VRGAPPPDKKLLEYHFVFACVWSFGGCMLVDKVSDYRTAFSKWWISEWKNVQFPEKGLVYDYYVDETQCLMVPWEDKVRFVIAAVQAERLEGCGGGWGGKRSVPLTHRSRFLSRAAIHGWSVGID
jgi:hypothetical protein